jgi:hypothetical protein
MRRLKQERRQNICRIRQSIKPTIKCEKGRIIDETGTHRERGIKDRKECKGGKETKKKNRKYLQFRQKCGRHILPNIYIYSWYSFLLEVESTPGS